jgi:hypothetical protein
MSRTLVNGNYLLGLQEEPEPLEPEPSEEVGEGGVSSSR